MADTEAPPAEPPPADDSEAPAADEGAPAEGDDAPATEGDAPAAEGGDDPAGEGDAPAEAAAKSDAPAEAAAEGDAPAEAAAEGEEAPAEDEAAPAEGEAPPAEDGAAPAEGGEEGAAAEGDAPAAEGEAAAGGEDGGEAAPAPEGGEEDAEAAPAGEEAPAEGAEPTPEAEPAPEASAGGAEAPDGEGDVPAPEQDPKAFVFGGEDGESKVLHDPPQDQSPPKPKKPAEPWLTGTYRTNKGVILTGEELCASIERMTNAYIDKYGMLPDDHCGPPHIATGVTSTRKTLSAEEIESMVSRLYTPKEGGGEGGEFKLERVMLKYDDEGNEQWVPVKQVSSAEQKEYMIALYERCRESKQKTKETLAAKYLKPLGQPRKP